MEKTHWKKLENPDYIGAYSLDDGQDKVVTIEKVVREMVTGTGGKKEECTVAYLKGEKPFILNRTNMKTIQKMYNTPYIEEWSGKKVTLYVARIRAFGEDNVECLRVRPQVPKVEKPELTPKHEAWAKAVEGLKNSSVTPEQIKKKYHLTETNLEKLLNESI